MRILTICFLIGVATLTACGSKKKKVTATQQPGAKPPPMRVDGYVANPQSFQENIEVPGNIVANEIAEIHPEVSGRIVQLNVAEGKYVSRGSLLAKLYDGDLRAQLNKLQVQLKLAEKTEER